ncbi:MAG: hypothetical protein R2783_03135 [Gelidibacter sp.]
MKNWFKITVIGLCMFSLRMQSQPYAMESEFPITMSMTPLMNSDRTIIERESKFTVTAFAFNEVEYTLDLFCHKAQKFTYGISMRMEDGLPINKTMKFFRELSFVDIRWDYNLKDFNFSLLVSTLMNFSYSIIEIEPYLDRRSLVAEEVYFNHEPTSFVNLSVQYRF